MQSILIICFSDLARDPRVNRQIRWLCEDHHVIAAGFSDPDVPGVEFIPLSREARNPIQRSVSAATLLARQYEKFYWKVANTERHLRALAGVRADLVIANDLETLPLALEVARGAKVILDAHEYSPKQYEDKLLFRVFHQRYRTYLCRRYIPRTNAMTTISRGIAKQYERDTGVRPVLITNSPDYESLTPRAIAEDRIRLVHHGGAIPSRHIEGMIEMMDYVDERFELTLMLVETSKRYFRKLKSMAAGRPNVLFRPPVPMRELPKHLNHFDIGVFLVPPVNFNYRHTLPNKLFEFVQARLMVAVGPSPEMARVVRQYGLGLVSESFSPRSLAAELNRVTPARIAAHKANSHAAAQELSAEHNRVRFVSLVESVLSGVFDPRAGMASVGSRYP